MPPHKKRYTVRVTLFFRRPSYRAHKDRARHLVLARLIELNRHYGFSYGRVTVRNQRSRWGSCSSKGNLNFNYRILFLPPALQDYIIAHELCHLKEFNHSPAFWELLSKSVPDHRMLRKELRRLDMRFVRAEPRPAAPSRWFFSYTYRRN